jgi:hypothetical protein
MAKTGLVIGLCAGAIVVLLGLRMTLFAPHQNDQEMIRDALAQSIKDSKDGKAGSLMDLLSDKFKVNGTQESQHDIARLVKQWRPDITVDSEDPIVSGDTAKIISTVHLKVSLPGGEIDKDVPNVTFTFQREDSSKFLVIPTKKWKLTDVDVPPGSIPTDLGS